MRRQALPDSAGGSPEGRQSSCSAPDGTAVAVVPAVRQHCWRCARIGTLEGVSGSVYAGEATEPPVPPVGSAAGGSARVKAPMLWSVAAALPPRLPSGACPTRVGRRRCCHAAGCHGCCCSLVGRTRYAPSPATQSSWGPAGHHRSLAWMPRHRQPTALRLVQSRQISAAGCAPHTAREDASLPSSPAVPATTGQGFWPKGAEDR